VDLEAGGTGNIANEPSPSTVLFMADATNAYMTIAAGFTDLSFQYGSYVGVQITVYDGLDGSGNVLASVPMLKTGVCGYDGIPPCGDPTGEYGIWRPLAVPFSGVAKSVRFTGEVYFMVLDDMTFTPRGAACTKTTYWLWDPKTDAQVGELLNNSASCIAVPYNIEVRPCTPPKKLPVVISLKNATSNGVIFNQNELAAPFYLWGDTTATGDVYKNKKPLPKGTYYLDSRVDGIFDRIKFTKTC
jgi:hypothetical protein